MTIEEWFIVSITVSMVMTAIYTVFISRIKDDDHGD